MGQPIGETFHQLMQESAYLHLKWPNWNPLESRLQTFTMSQVQTIRRRFTGQVD